MLLREFLILRVAPLHARTHPLWRLGGEEDKLRLSPEALPDEELAAALRLLVGDDQEYPPSAFVPLFRCKDGAQVVAARPTFDGRGLVPPAPPAVPAATAPVEVSSDDSRKEEEEEEDEERDSEATLEGMGEISPLCKADLVHTMPDDDEADVLQRGEPPVIPTRGRPTPAAKKRKDEAVVLLGTNLPAPAASPSMEKGSVAAHVSPARSSSRGLGENPWEESAPVAPLAPEAPVSGSAAEPGHDDLREGEAGRRPSSAAREAALKDVEPAQDRCRALEAELKTLRNERAEEARSRKAEEEKMKAREDAIKGRDAELEQSAKVQDAERGRQEELEQKVKAEKAELDAKAKVLAEDCAASALLEERSRVALKALYEKGLEKPLTTDENEEEARVLSSAALTHVFNHLHLRDPAARLDELLEPVDDEHCAAATAAVKGRVEALLNKFRAFAPAPSTGGATNPAAPAGGRGEGDATKEGAPLAGVGSIQG
nr:neurosecretory protein VGF-like [Aegilops tauschii subsp. strangulata]